MEIFGNSFEAKIVDKNSVHKMVKITKNVNIEGEFRGGDVEK
jgi:hypothetical protein